MNDVKESQTSYPVYTQSPEPEKITYDNTVMYQLIDYSQMMSYVIRTRTGEIIVIDGGYYRNGPDILKLLKELTGKDVPTINAWIFTHCHDDHVSAFNCFVSEYLDKFNVDSILYNFPSGEYIEQYENSQYHTYVEFTAAISKIPKDKVVIVKEGDSFEIGGIKMDVLLTPDESAKENVLNESSVVYSMMIEDQRVIFLGDLGARSGYRLRKTYGKDLKCDVVQMAHHGSNGVDRSVYNMLSPSVCLWPTPLWLWENDNGGGYDSGPWETITVYEYMRDKLGVKLHFVAKDGVQRIEFPLKWDE